MSKKNSLSINNRRNFLKKLSLTGAAGLICSKEVIASVNSPKSTSRVVTIFNNNAVDKTKKTINPGIIKSMVDEGITAFTNIPDVGNAWKSIFPGITASKIIGIKVNTLFDTKNNGTHPQITTAVVDGLIQMDFDGTKFPDNNIIIFDLHNNCLTQQGYKINKSGSGVRCFPSSTYSTETYDAAGIKVKLSTIITQQIDYMVNIAFLKQHFLSGVSLCLKNHYGSIHDPAVSPLFHDEGKHGDPYIPAITALTPIKNKQKFCIIDALFGVTTNGPSGSITCNPNKIIMGQDVVAVDCTGRDLLTENGLSTYERNKSTHIDAAATKYSLGTNDPNQIENVKITNTATDIKSTISEGHYDLFHNYPNPFHEETNIQFNLQKSEFVSLKVYDYSGKTINQLISKNLKTGLHRISWAGTDLYGQTIKPGIYLCELKTKSFKKTIAMQKI